MLYIGLGIFEPAQKYRKECKHKLFFYNSFKALFFDLETFAMWEGLYSICHNFCSLRITHFGGQPQTLILFSTLHLFSIPNYIVSF